MNKSHLIGILLGITVAMAVAGFAGHTILDEIRTGASSYEVPPSPAPIDCGPRDSEHEQRPRDEHRVVGTVIGALIGGAVGRDVGDRDITTAAGAAAGAYAGNRVQKEIQERNAEDGTETACRPANS